MLPAGLTAKAIQLCAAGLGATGSPVPASYGVTVHTGAALVRQPGTQADAEATVRDLVALGADFQAGPLAIDGRDFATYGVTASSVFDPCALAHIDDGMPTVPGSGSATVSSVTALLRRAFGARITDTIRPMNASFGARHSWHKVGQAVDFVPAGGVDTITREQIRALMGASNIRVLELLGPGDRGHATHWHIAFARPGQVIDRTRVIEGDEDWAVTVASADASPVPPQTDASATSAVTPRSPETAPARWDVFASADWHATHGGGS